MAGKMKVIEQMDKIKKTDKQLAEEFFCWNINNYFTALYIVFDLINYYFDILVTTSNLLLRN